MDCIDPDGFNFVAKEVGQNSGTIGRHFASGRTRSH